LKLVVATLLDANFIPQKRPFGGASAVLHHARRFVVVLLRLRAVNVLQQQAVLSFGALYLHAGYYDEQSKNAGDFFRPPVGMLTW
jgi:hypothetical protein